MMVPDIVVRALWAVSIIALGLLAYRALNAALLARTQKNGAARPENLPEGWRGVPTILYFTTPSCIPCKTIQRPALSILQNDLGDRLQVIEVDATERPDLASRWGVLSVPTTFILAPDGKLRHVNHGATRADKLRQQVEEVI